MALDLSNLDVIFMPMNFLAERTLNPHPQLPVQFLAQVLTK